MTTKKINWEEIEELVDGKYRVFFDQIDPELMEMVLDEERREQVYSSVSRMLLLQYPDEATPEKIEEVVGMMVRVVKSLKYSTINDMENGTKLLPVKSNIQFSDLEKLDIRVGLIEKVESIEKSDKLVRLTVDFGEFKRNILVGMKQEREDPTEIEGKQALFVVNLEPKEMMGEMSEGMLFDIGYANGITPVLAMPEKNVPNGVNAG